MKGFRLKKESILTEEEIAQIDDFVKREVDEIYEEKCIKADYLTEVVLRDATDISIKTVSADIKNAGFQPTKSLVDGIRLFSAITGKTYTVKELAELNKTKPDFSKEFCGEEKQVCFNRIVKECQRQELEKISFLNQSRQMEQALVPDM